MNVFKHVIFLILLVHANQASKKYVHEKAVKNKRQCFIQSPLNDRNKNETQASTQIQSHAPRPSTTTRKSLQNEQDIEAQLMLNLLSSSSLSSSKNLTQSQVDMFINYLVEQSKIQSSLWSVNTTRASTINKTQSIYPPGMYFILKNIIINLKLELIIAYIKPFLCCI